MVADVKICVAPVIGLGEFEFTVSCKKGCIQNMREIHHMDIDGHSLTILWQFGIVLKAIIMVKIDILEVTR